MSLEEVQSKVDEWIKSSSSGYFPPLTNLGILMEEVGEVARVMVRTYGEQRTKPSDDNVQLADEMADVLWVLSALANQCNINLTDAMQENWKKKEMRDRKA
jgi:NTP pyrophosphatase (non-canonical NTP hydrolase)